MLVVQPHIRSSFRLHSSLSTAAGVQSTHPANPFTGEPMGATPEVLVKRKVRKILDAAGAYYAMPIGTGYGNSGVPDFLVCVNGRFVGVECKAGRGKTNALQDSHLAKIRTAGGVALVIREDNLNELEEVLRARTTEGTGGA
jgi:pantoate kinase